jgi:hypothetical protein
MVKMSQQAAAAWFDRFHALDPSVVGSCESVCYLRGIFNSSCIEINSKSDQSASSASSSSSSGSNPTTTKQAAAAAAAAQASPREAACRQNAFCSWSSASRYCSINLMGADAWGQAAARAAAQCSALSKDRSTCEGGSPQGSASVLAGRVRQYRDYQQPTGSYACKA